MTYAHKFSTSRARLLTWTKIQVYICKVMISDLEIQLNMEEGVQGNRVGELVADNEEPIDFMGNRNPSYSLSR